MAKRKVPLATPGEILLEEFLKPLGVTQYRLAKEIGVPQRRIGEIVARLKREGLYDNTAIIVTADLSQAVQVANAFATEHLQIIVRDEQRVLAEIRHAGAILIGPYTPVPLGDYSAGPSHVLPTGGTARFFGPLNVNDFLKASSIVRYDEAGLKQDAQDVIDFATAEGLTAHAAAVKARLGHL